MEHEAFLGFAFEDFEALHVVAGAESGGHQSLSFAAGEDCGAVSTRKDADLDPDVADLVEGASIGTALVVDHVLAEDSFAQGFVIGLELLLGIFVVRRESPPAVAFSVREPEL